MIFFQPTKMISVMADTCSKAWFQKLTELPLGPERVPQGGSGVPGNPVAPCIVAVPGSPATLAAHRFPCSHAVLPHTTGLLGYRVSVMAQRPPGAPSPRSRPQAAPWQGPEPCGLAGSAGAAAAGASWAKSIALGFASVEIKGQSDEWLESYIVCPPGPGSASPCSMGAPVPQGPRGCACRPTRVYVVCACVGAEGISYLADSLSGHGGQGLAVLSPPPVLCDLLCAGQCVLKMGSR